MGIAVLVGRVLFGISFVVFGLGGLLELVPRFESDQKAANDLLQALWKTGWLMPLVCVLHALCGAFVLFGRFVPLALAVHLPVTVNMVLFHALMDPETGIVAYTLGGIHGLLILAYFSSFRPLLRFRARPFER